MRKALLSISILFLFGCAQQVAPTGGPKDETPPKVLAESPENLSTNFNAEQIIISFDEYVKLTSVSEQVVISPPMLRAPSYQLKKKSLIVKFEQPLAENTTYTINFGEAIRDNNEGNILANYTYVFSTGAHLDSMQVKGKLIDALTGEAVPDALVMLYKNNVASLPIDTTPNYFSRSNESGLFHIEHVADQAYKIFALKDENANYRFDVPTEQIGFLDSLIVPFSKSTPTLPDSTRVDSLANDSTVQLTKKGSSTIPSYDMTMFVEEDTTQFLKKAYCEHFGKLVFVYNRPVNNLQIEMRGSSLKREWLLKDYNATRDSVIVWTTDAVPDTLDLLLDIGRPTKDTVELVMKERSDEITVVAKSSSKGKKSNRVEKFQLKGIVATRNGRSPKPGSPLSIVWNHPVIGMDISKLKLYEDSVRVNYDITSNDQALRTFDIRYPWKKDRNYQLLILDSAFNDIYDLWNDTIDVTFTGTDKEMLGELSLKITENPNSRLVIELLNSAGVVIDSRSVNGVGTEVFEKLDPGKYSIQIVSDINGNGRWDSGRYADLLQPEPIQLIEKGAEVRANWELELEWNPNENK